MCLQNATNAAYTNKQAGGRRKVGCQSGLSGGVSARREHKQKACDISADDDIQMSAASVPKTT
jgi:hypothetical protein